MASTLRFLVILAERSSDRLCDTLESLDLRESELCDLVQKIKTLRRSLRSLQETIRHVPGVDLYALNHPLQWWADVCKELESCCDSSGVNLHDLKSSRYTGSDIHDFGRLLDEYDSIMTIAMNYAHFNPNPTTPEELTAYEHLLQTTTEKLHARLARVNEIIEALRGPNVEQSEAYRSRKKAAEEEKECTQGCLRICEQSSGQINLARSSSGCDASSPVSEESEASTNPKDYHSDIRIVGNGDSFQLMFTTKEPLRGVIDGKGSFNRHGGGFMQDDTIKHIATVLASTIPVGKAGSVSGQVLDPVHLREARNVNQALRYEKKYGLGRANKSESAVQDMQAVTRTGS